MGFRITTWNGKLSGGESLSSVADRLCSQWHTVRAFPNLFIPRQALKVTRNPFGYQPWRDQKTFAAMFEVLEADIVVFQETKIQRKDLSDDMVLVPGWDCYWSLPKHKKGSYTPDFELRASADFT